MKRLSWFTFFLIFLASCLDDPDCYQLHNATLGVTFRVIGTGQADTVRLKNSATTFLSGVSYSYQLNYFKEEELIRFEQPEKTNSLSFGYTVKNQFISEDCGSAFVLSGLHILEHDFDSARVVNPTPSKSGGTNIEIYRCPETDTLTINFNQLYATTSATTSGVTITNKRSVFLSHAFDPISTDGAGPVFTGRDATVNLPVNLDQNQTVYVFKTGTSQDTLVITYNRRDTALYRPCGVQTFITNVTFRDHTFDSLSYGLDEDEEPIRTLQDPHVANLRVFDCPKTNVIQVLFKKNGTASTVTIKSITGDYFAGDLLTTPHVGNSLSLPMNLNANASTFYLQYADDSKDTLSLQYSRTDLTLFKACKDPIIINLTEVNDLPNIEVVQSTLQYPLVTNVEITVD